MQLCIYLINNQVIAIQLRINVGNNDFHVCCDSAVTDWLIDSGAVTTRRAVILQKTLIHNSFQSSEKNESYDRSMEVRLFAPQVNQDRPTDG